MSSPLDRQHRSSADYIDRTIATVRNHRDADNCWPQWANIFADEIEDLRADVLALVNVAKAAEGVMTQMDYETPHHTRLREALDALDKEPA